MIHVKNSTQYYINERALTFSENDLNDPNRVAVSLVSGTVILVHVPGTIDYASDGNYDRWTLRGYSTRLVSKEIHYVYARLSRTDRTALIVFSVKNYNIDGSITTVTGKDENGNDITETSDPSADYFFVRIGELTATDGTSSRELTYDSGLLSTDKGNAEKDSLSEMWELSKMSTPWLIRAKQWLQSFTVKGFITLIGGLNFSKGQEGDEKPVTDIKRSTDSDSEYLLDENGEPVTDEDGVKVKNPNYVPVSDETIPTTQYVQDKVKGLDDKFIRKDQDDRTSFNLSIGGKTTTEGGIQIGKDYVSGLIGSGGNIDETGRAELESLVLRSFLEVPEFRYNRVTVRMGDEITSVSAGVIKSVTVLSETTGTIELKLENGEIGMLQKDDIVFQIYSDLTEEGKGNNATETTDDGKGNRTIKGFATVMFRVNEILDPVEDGGTCSKISYSLRPIADGGNGVHPYQFGTFVQRGNFNNTERQTIIYQGIYPKPYTRYMFGVNNWEFTAQMIGMQIGDLSNLGTAFGMNMTGYSAYLNNVYFTGMIRQLYIPQWMNGKSAAQNGTLVYMGGDHYVSKGDTTNPPLFDLTDEDGNSLLFADEDGEGNLLDLNNEEYDMLAKKGDDGVGIKSNVVYYLISDTNEKPLDDSSDWGISMIQPTDLKPYLWKKTVVTYTNLTTQTTIECISVRGKDGTSVSIKGSFDTEEELLSAFPNGPENPSDAYIVGGNLYVWTGSEWKNVGAIQGEKGDTAYVHIKYANETASGTQVAVGSTVVTLSFTANEGEDTGDWMGVYTDHTPSDSTNIADYKWKNIKGIKGEDSTSYSLSSPVGAINFTSDGYPNPTSFVVTMKKKTGEGDIVACSDFYLATWKYDGNWQLVSVSTVKTSSVTIIPAASTAYKQYKVTAHTVSSVSSSTPVVDEIGIGVSFDGMKGDKGEDGKDGENGKDGKDGEDGIFVYDCGLYSGSREYYYQTIDAKVRRDKMVYEIDGGFYNFLVRSRQEDGSAGLVNTPPTSSAGDENWEVMSQFQSLIANTVFATNANIGGFMVSAEKMLSQTEVTNSEGNTESAFELNGSKGTMTMRQSGGTVWQLDGQGAQSVGNSTGERIVIDPNSRSISSYDAQGVERTVIDGSEYTVSELTGASGGTVTMTSNASNTSGFTASVTNMGAQTLFYDISSMFYSTPGTLSVSISSMEIQTTFHPQTTRSVSTLSDSDDYVTNPFGEIIVQVETYETSTSTTLLSRKLIATVSADGSVLGGTVSSSEFQNISPVVIGKGYHKIVASLTARNGNTTGVTTVRGTWVITSATVSVESYVSRHFSNGMFLSKSSSEHFLAMTDNGYMNVQVASAGRLFTIKNGSLTIDGAKQPATVYVARVSDSSTSQSVAPTKTELTYVTGLGGVAITKLSSPQRYRFDFPSNYGLTSSNMLVNLTGYGVCANTDNPAKATLYSYSVASDGMMKVDIMVSDDETPNYGGFYIEVKKLM